MKILLLIFAKLIFKTKGEFISPYNSEFSRGLYKRWSNVYNKYNPLPKTDLKISDLIEKLKKILDKYEGVNHDYFLNISKNHCIDLQIVHPYRFLHVNRDKSFIDFGFAIYISFDPAYEQNRLNIEKFKKLDSFREFLKDDYEGIPCFLLNCYTDIEKTFKITLDILEKLFDYKEESAVYFDFYDEGSVQENLKELNKKENSFSRKMCDKNDNELLNYIKNQEQFQEDAIYAAAWELEKRGYRFEK